MKKEKQQQAPAFDGPIRLGRNIPNDEPIMPMGDTGRRTSDND